MNTSYQDTISKNQTNGASVVEGPFPSTPNLGDQFGFVWRTATKEKELIVRRPHRNTNSLEESFSY